MYFKIYDMISEKHVHFDCLKIFKIDILIFSTITVTPSLKWKLKRSNNIFLQSSLEESSSSHYKAPQMSIHMYC